MPSDFIIEDGISEMFGLLLGPVETAEEEFNNAADEIVAYARDNAPWSDITGQARNGLNADVYVDGDQVVLELYHTVDYGLFLETIQGGTYAIIMPTLETFAPEIFSRVGGVVTGGGESVG